MSSTARAPRRPAAGRKPAPKKGRTRVAAVKARKAPARRRPAKTTARTTAKTTAKTRAKPTNKKAARAAAGKAPPRGARAGRPPESARLDWSGLTLMDGLDLAILVEAEAEERYGRLSALVGGRYAGDAGDVFRAMVRNERLHREELEAQRTRLFGDAPRRLRAEQLDDVEAPDWSSAGVFISARQATEAAIASEEKAHAFYVQAGEHVKGRAVRKLFADLAEEELRHRATLRALAEKLPPGPDVDPELADEPGSDPGN